MVSYGGLTGIPGLNVISVEYEGHNILHYLCKFHNFLFRHCQDMADFQYKVGVASTQSSMCCYIPFQPLGVRALGYRCDSLLVGWPGFMLIRFNLCL